MGWAWLVVLGCVFCCCRGGRSDRAETKSVGAVVCGDGVVAVVVPFVVVVAVRKGFGRSGASPGFGGGGSRGFVRVGGGSLGAVGCDGRAMSVV